MDLSMNPFDIKKQSAQNGGFTCSPDATKLLKAVDKENLQELKDLIARGNHINSHGGSFHETALHRASQIRWDAGVRYLLSAGASVFVKNQFGQLPLHYAVASKSRECIKLLLESGRAGVLDHRDMRGHTPLHDASAAGSISIINILLKAGALVRAKDNNGETPLHKAAKAKSVPSMVALMNAGADMSVVDDKDESPLSYTLQQHPGTLDAVFDQCFITNSLKMTNKTLEVTFNYLPLVGSYQTNQVKNLQSFVELGHAKILGHPLCESFLLLKWMKVRKVFLVEVIFYVFYNILTTLLTFNKYVWSSNNIRNGSVEYEYLKNVTSEEWAKNHAYESGPDISIGKENDQHIRALKGILISMSVGILIMQLLSLIQNRLAWFMSLSSVLHVVITVLAMSVVPGPVPNELKHHLSSYLLILMWTQCMLLIGRFPTIGIYITMLARVTMILLRIFFMYLCLLIGFSSALYVALHYSRNSEDGKDIIFDNPLFTFMKTVTMMIGEVDFDVDFVELLSHLCFTSHLIFTFFVVFVTIILSNVLVALAVNDVQGLRNSAHLERLIKQTDLIFKVEKNFSTVFYLTPYIKIAKLRDWVTKLSNMCKHDCHNAKVTMCPNHPKESKKIRVRENRSTTVTSVPSHVLANLFECLKAREADITNTKASTKNKRGSRMRRGAYYQEKFDDIPFSLEEFETNVMEIVNEKVEEVIDSNISLTERMSVLEKKIEHMLSLLQVKEAQEPSNLNTSNRKEQEATVTELSNYETEDNETCA